MENVVVLGASTNPERYSYRAVAMLAEHGHQVFPVSPSGQEVLGHAGYRALGEIAEPIDTVTVYLNPSRLEPLLDELIAKPPRRVIFNPGAESETAEHKLQSAGIDTLRACTLVLLSTGQFESA